MLPALVLLGVAVKVALYAAVALGVTTAVAGTGRATPRQLAAGYGAAFMGATVLAILGVMNARQLGRRH